MTSDSPGHVSLDCWFASVRLQCRFFCFIREIYSGHHSLRWYGERIRDGDGTDGERCACESCEAATSRPSFATAPVDNRFVPHSFGSCRLFCDSISSCSATRAVPHPGMRLPGERESALERVVEAGEDRVYCRGCMESITYPQGGFAGSSAYAVLSLRRRSFGNLRVW